MLSAEEGEVYQPLTLDEEESGLQQIEYHLDFKSSLVVVEDVVVVVVVEDVVVAVVVSLVRDPMDGRDLDINTRLSGLESPMMEHILKNESVRETWQNYFQIKVI